MLDYQIDLTVLVVIVLFNIGLCWVLCKKYRNFNHKIAIISIFSFNCLYAGCGISLKGCNSLYALYYVVYFLVFFFVLKARLTERKTTKREAAVDYLLIRYATTIIIVYTLLNFSSLVYPVIKVGNLIHPPSPDVRAWLDLVYDNQEKSFLGSVIYMLQNLLLPFYYFSLYKYNDNIKKIATILFLNLYISYCAAGNIGRSSILVSVLIIFFALLNKFDKKNRKRIIIGSLLVLPLLLVGFYQYSLIRVGDDINIGISTVDIISILFGQEIGYPLWFDSYYGHYNTSSTVKYFVWLLLLLFPGFMKGDMGNYRLNAEFTYLTTGMLPGDPNFSIKLPGMVGESIYVLGPYFFFIHAVLFAIIVSIVLNYLLANKKLSFLLYFYIISFSFDIARGGTTAVYPLVIKHFLLFIIIVYLVERKLRKHKVNISYD